MKKNKNKNEKIKHEENFIKLKERDCVPKTSQHYIFLREETEKELRETKWKYT